MGGLKDQLLRAGLVNEKQIKQAQKQKIKEAHQARSHGQQAPPGDNRKDQAQANKIEKDRLLNQQRQQAAEQKAVLAQIRQLLDVHRHAEWAGECPFNFEDQGKVKRIHVTESVRGQLIRGVIAIVRFDGRYELVPADVGKKIRDRDAAAVILNQGRGKDVPEKAEEDPYAGYEVPDDLIW